MAGGVVLAVRRLSGSVAQNSPWYFCASDPELGQNGFQSRRCAKLPPQYFEHLRHGLVGDSCFNHEGTKAQSRICGAFGSGIALFFVLSVMDFASRNFFYFLVRRYSVDFASSSGSKSLVALQLVRGSGAICAGFRLGGGTKSAWVLRWIVSRRLAARRSEPARFCSWGL
jgi:hypothetical protein